MWLSTWAVQAGKPGQDKPRRHSQNVAAESKAEAHRARRWRFERNGDFSPAKSAGVLSSVYGMGAKFKFKAKVNGVNEASLAQFTHGLRREQFPVARIKSGK
jgi:hypothetical protein